MRAAMSQLNLSARAYHRILKLARTIANLAGREEIQICAFGGGAATQTEADDRGISKKFAKFDPDPESGIHS